MNCTVLSTAQIAINQLFQMTQPTTTFTEQHAMGKGTTAEGRVMVPKRMNFRKSSERGAIFNQKFIFQILDLQTGL